MKNEKFSQAIDEIFWFLLSTQKLQMDQMKSNIKAVYDANVSELDVNAIAQQILETPIDLRPALGMTIIPAQPAIHLQNEMVCTAEKSVPPGEIGNKEDLSYVNVGADRVRGKEFYHHCQRSGNKLVRLIYHIGADVYACPVCRKEYK